jgi:tetratricopeptide (TPR) repeat protein
MYENLPATMTNATHLYKMGRLEDAAQICAVILNEQHENFDALHLLGVIRWTQGRLQEALTLQETALAAKPESYGANTYIGVILADLEHFEEAIYSYRRALEIKPDYAEVHNNLGNVLRAVGRLEEAIASYCRALAIKPDFAEAHFNLGYTFQALSRYEQAISSYQRALAIKPDYAVAHYNCGVALQALRRHEEAIASYRTVLATNPGYAWAHNNLGTQLDALNRYEEAIACYHNALSIKPDFAEAHNNLGIVLAALGRHKEAIASYNNALRIKSDYADAHRNKGFASLAMGDFETGWPEYEWRWETAQGLSEKRSFTQPLWLGREDIAGKTILLYCEQGLGDTIQFVRYLPLVATMGGTVILEVQPGLKTLFENLKGANAILEHGEPLPSFDVHCPLMSLPLAFKTRSAAIPASIPYILPDPGRQTEWEKRLHHCEHPRIGIAWSGNPNVKRDRNRSIPLQKLMPLIRKTGLTFYVLQKEIRTEDFELLKSSTSFKNYSAQLSDFADTAALMSFMDLVISTDTSLAHLAGAMGKPTWILLMFSADWRWLLHRQDSPWYPTVRLFRQPKLCDWESVIESVSLECKKLFL